MERPRGDRVERDGVDSTLPRDAPRRAGDVAARDAPAAAAADRARRGGDRGVRVEVSLRARGRDDAEERRRGGGDGGCVLYTGPHTTALRGERRSLRTFPVVSLRPPLAFNPRHRCLSTPADAFELHPDSDEEEEEEEEDEVAAKAAAGGDRDDDDDEDARGRRQDEARREAGAHDRAGLAITSEARRDAVARGGRRRSRNRRRFRRPPPAMPSPSPSPSPPPPPPPPPPRSASSPHVVVSADGVAVAWPNARAAISGASTIEALRFEVDALKRVVQAAATERELLVESHAVDAAAHARESRRGAARDARRRARRDRRPGSFRSRPSADADQRAFLKARSIHWSPYDRVGVVNADP